MQYRQETEDSASKYAYLALELFHTANFDAVGNILEDHTNSATLRVVRSDDAYIAVR